MSYLPKTDASGLWTLKAPFDKLITPRVVYVCRSIRSLNEILANGETAFETYYQPVALTQDNFNQDLLQDVKIVGLQAGSGDWVYVPHTYILQAPDGNGVRYSPIVLGINLGSIPDDLNLDGTIAMVKNLVKDTLGVDPDVRAVLTAEPAMLPHATHQRLEAARAEAIKLRVSDAQRATQAELAYAQLLVKYHALEEFVRTRFPTP